MATSLKIDDTLKSRVHHLTGQRRRSPHWITEPFVQDIDLDQHIVVVEPADEFMA